MKQVFIIFSVIGFCFTAKAQEYSLEKVLELALKNNHNIKVSANNVEMAENSSGAGNAGMLPTVSANAGASYSNQNMKLELLAQPDPISIERDGAQSTSLNAGVGLNWVVFDGFAMFKNYDRLQLLIDLEDAKTRATVESTLMQVISTYYIMAAAKNNKKVALESVELSNDRIRRAKSNFESGGSSSLNYLSAQVDLNTDSVTWANAEANYAQSSNSLNLLTGYQLPMGFDISEEVSINSSMDFAELEKQSKETNAQLVNLEYAKLVAEKDVQIANAGYLPTIALNADYGFRQQNNEIGNLLESQNLGYTAGITLSYPIFQGSQRKTRANNAQVRLENQEELRLNTIDQLKTDLNNSWIDYEKSLKILGMNERNLKNAEFNFYRIRDLYQLGSLTNVEFRTAQINYLRAQISITNSKYQVRLSEFELIRVSGLLVKPDN
ncbi:MAG: TolC family protein [Salibacteraceae bacterium]|nr:TolC family protein [Salibacteraceae bacterium]|tara:strand:+ start:15846 stop:17162 length:1317 start_codon:yes stop_codon:yes gene_type:complete